MRHALGVILLLVVGSAQAATVTYNYAGPVFTATSSELPPLYEGLSITGSFTMEELAPSTSTNLIGSLPSFSFSDGIRSISNASIVPGPGDVSGPTADEFYVDQFTIITDSSGDISAWFIRFINSSLVNALGTFQNGTGSDSTRITSGVNGCVTSQAGTHCLGTVSTDASGTTGIWVTSATVVPIPAAVWLFGSGLGLLGWFRRRQSA